MTTDNLQWLKTNVRYLKNRIEEHNALCESVCMVNKHNGLCKEGERCGDCSLYYLIEYELPLIEEIKNEL